MPADERVPEGVERPDIDPSVHHGIETAARRDERADASSVEIAPAAPATEQVVAQGVEPRARMRDGPAERAAERILRRFEDCRPGR